MSTVSVSVRDSANNEVSGTNGQHYTCADSPNNVFTWQGFPGGNYTVQLTGYSSGGTAIMGRLASVTLTNGAENLNTVNFGGSDLTSAGLNDIVVAKFDPMGNHIFSKEFGDAAPQSVAGVATDAAGDFYVTGYFAGTVAFPGDAKSSSSCGKRSASFATNCSETGNK